MVFWKLLHVLGSWQYHFGNCAFVISFVCLNLSESYLLCMCELQLCVQLLNQLVNYLVIIKIAMDVVYVCDN